MQKPSIFHNNGGKRALRTPMEKIALPGLGQAGPGAWLDPPAFDLADPGPSPAHPGPVSTLFLFSLRASRCVTLTLANGL